MEGAVAVFKKRGPRQGVGRINESRSTNGSYEASQNAGPSKRPHDVSRRDDSEEASLSEVILKRRKEEYNPLRQGTTRVGRIRAAARDARGGQDHYGDDDEDDAAYGLADDVSARRRGGTDRFGESGVTSHARASGSSAARGIEGNREDATREGDWSAERQGHASTNQGKAPDEENTPDGIYRGQSAYSSFQQKKDVSGMKHLLKGPQRGSATIRSVTVTDYQPDICKDYKETGYCGFGDTCKFLHDRSDYLAGWQLNEILPNSAARRREDVYGGDGTGGENGEEEEEEEIPFACLICRQPFTDPVVTRCGHYFCSACAIKRFSKTPKCFACGAQTGGLFNTARRILERMEKRKEDKEEGRRERQKAWGIVGAPRPEEIEGVGDDDLGIEGVEVQAGSPESGPSQEEDQGKDHEADESDEN